jgi:hypothetical protein
LNAGTLVPETDAVAGIQVTENWGAYQAGLEVAEDYNSADQVNYLAGGVVLGISTIGTIQLLWRENGAILGYAMPLGVGATVT